MFIQKALLLVFIFLTLNLDGHSATFYTLKRSHIFLKELFKL